MEGNVVSYVISIPLLSVLKVPSGSISEIFMRYLMKRRIKSFFTLVKKSYNLTKRILLDKEWTYELIRKALKEIRYLPEKVNLIDYIPRSFEDFERRVKSFEIPVVRVNLSTFGDVELYHAMLKHISLLRSLTRLYNSLEQKEIPEKASFDELRDGLIIGLQSLFALGLRYNMNDMGYVSKYKFEIERIFRKLRHLFSTFTPKLFDIGIREEILVREGSRYGEDLA